jgi:polar amino acid transport system substrate-binding protein
MTAASRAIVQDLAPSRTLRAAINLGNPVLAQGTAAEPSGVTVDLARELASRLGIGVELVCVDAARASFEAISADRADICFLAIEPAREAELAFTAPYVVIEGVFLVPRDSSIRTIADVDRPDVRIGVNDGSAYDLFLSRTLERATVVRAADGFAVFRERGLEAMAGIRQPLVALAAADDGLRLLDDPFMEIRQALATTRSRTAETVAFLWSFVEELKANGFVAASLRRANQLDAAVAPPG